MYRQMPLTMLPAHIQLDSLPQPSRNNITGLIDILGDLWPFVTLSYLARLAAGKRRPMLILAGTVTIFPLVFALEWYQQYLPGRSPDITDAIIATIAWLLPWFYPALSKRKQQKLQPADRTGTHRARATTLYTTCHISTHACCYCRSHLEA